MSGKLVLLDGYSLMYRAYHGLAAPMSAADGTPTNAIHAFMMMLTKVIADEKPELMAVALDTHAKTLRAQSYEPYKANRKPMPDDLRAQDPIIRELIEYMHIPMLQLEGYEGDDILGTVSAAAEREGRETVIVTGDRDSFQLAGENTTILYTKKGITDTVRVTPDYILTTYGVAPVQLIDVKGLMGDTSDNIPGIAGIGEKTALKLISTYGTMEAALAHASEQKGKLRERLEGGTESATISKRLAAIDRAVPITIDWESMRLRGIADAVPRLKQLSLNVAVRRVLEIAQDISAVEIPSAEVPQPTAAVEILDSLEAFSAACAGLSGTIAVYADDAALSVASEGREIRIAMGGGDLLDPGIEAADAWRAIMPLMSAPGAKVLYNVKAIPVEWDAIGGEITDVMLTAYALNAGRGAFDAKSLCEQEGIMSFESCPAASLLELSKKHAEAMRATGADRIYRDIELPLARVLRDMEKAGMLVVPEVLEQMSVKLRARIGELAEELYTMMGEKINLNSPKQLGEVLFVKMGLPTGKKTSRGFSTSAAVLEELADDYPVCAKLLEYRKYTKLEGTYIHQLIDLRDENGRIHSRFDQVGTATGRISSAEPNLQNIPVRTELGKEIRAAFVAAPGCVLVDADYSQIELRVLAHMSGDETMRDAFRQGQDIHARTASEVYGVPLAEVTPQMRSATKAVNFGIVYGISDFSLAKNIQVSRKEAKAFIDRYFERYPGVKRYMDEAVKTGYEQGYVTTMLGRRRYLPELKSPNYNMRSFGERCAMNSPIQGTAADIIKLAMVRVSDMLREKKLKTKLVLQVHDELILEAPLEEEETVKALLRGAMENVVKLEVPLVADVHTGGDWRACK